MMTARIRFSNSRHNFATSPRQAPEFCWNVLPSQKTEGVGNAGCPIHPQPRVQWEVSTRASSPQIHRIHPALPHAMVLTVSFGLSLATGRFCHRRQRSWRVKTRSGRHAFRKLDASVGASGPHDFAVPQAASFVGAPFDRSQVQLRGPALRSRARLKLPRPKHPAPRS
jgi:hypothetical protein